MNEIKEKMPRATHQGKLEIASKKLPCAVLDNGIRILNLKSVFVAFDRPARSTVYADNRAIDVPSFIDARNLQPYITKNLKAAIEPISYVSNSGRIVKGYNAEILPLLCDVYLEARKNKALHPTQKPLAVSAEILVRGLSKIGIIALVDEATGYQEVRDRLALQKILEMYIAKELQPWVKTFPDDFYEQLFKLKGWQYKPLSVKRPQVIGRITNDIIYERIERGVLDELKSRTPKDDKGRRKHHFHRLLTDDIGHPKLREHISNVITLMKASASYSNFYRLLQRALPKLGHSLELPFDEANIN